MSKPIPLLPGKFYHIFNRGNNRENIFLEERNYRHFMHLYAEHIEPVADTYAYSLLRNHFHLLVRIKDDAETLRVSETRRVPAVSQAFSNFFNAYTKAFNVAYNRTGSLFEHPFDRKEVTSEVYFVRLVIYIHLNPQKHGLVDDFRAWPYSSYNALVSTRPTRLKRDDVWSWFDGMEHIRKLHVGQVEASLIEPLMLEDFD